MPNHRPLVLFLAVLLSFGCATVRVPVGGLASEVAAPAGAIAEPQVAVWVESDDAADPGDQAKAEAEARAALRRAVGGYSVAAGSTGAADPVLVVREQAVARTDSRKRAQVAAVTGLVVGAVVVVAVVIAAASSGKGGHLSLPSGGAHAVSGGAHAAASAARAAGSVAHVAGAAARTTGAAARLSSAVARAAGGAHGHFLPRGWGSPGAHHAPWGWAGSREWHGRAGWHHGRCWTGPCTRLGLDWTVDGYGDGYGYPEGYAEGQADGYAERWEEAGDPDEEGFVFVAPEPGPAPEPPAPVALLLPPVEPLPLEGRGFFSGDEVQLQVDLLDRESGRLLWTKTVRESADSSDTGDVHRLLALALRDQRWVRPVR